MEIIDSLLPLRETQLLFVAGRAQLRFEAFQLLACEHGLKRVEPLDPSLDGFWRVLPRRAVETEVHALGLRAVFADNMRPLRPIHGLVEGYLAISESASNTIHVGIIVAGMRGGNL